MRAHAHVQVYAFTQFCKCFHNFDKSCFGINGLITKKINAAIVDYAVKIIEAK